MWAETLAILRPMFLPAYRLDVRRRPDLMCVITWESLEELVHRGTAVALGQGPQLRVYDLPGFLRAWCHDGLDPSTRQLASPYELRRIIDVPSSDM